MICDVMSSKCIEVDQSSRMGSINRDGDSGMFNNRRVQDAPLRWVS